MIKNEQDLLSLVVKSGVFKVGPKERNIHRQISMGIETAKAFEKAFHKSKGRTINGRD